MGNLFCSPCSDCSKDATRSADEESNFHTDPGALFNNKLAAEFDLKSSIFEGAFVDQKFTSKTLYEPRFVWVSLENLTIHMSQHNTKERRHKEASLSDVTNVERGAPKKIKPSESEQIDESCCMAVNFQRGGGIDLKFSTAAECTLWFKVLSKIVDYLHKNEKMKLPM